MQTERRRQPRDLPMQDVKPAGFFRRIWLLDMAGAALVASLAALAGVL